MSINYQLLYYRPAELRTIAEREANKQDLAMILRTHYRDGFVDGYGPKQEGKTEQKRQS